MKTIIVKIDKDNLKDDFAVSQLEKAGEIIRNGGLVAFQRDCLRIGTNALAEEAAKKVYEAKGRPSDNPLIVHISNLNMLDDIVTQVPEVAKKLMDAFWPGPMTLIFNKSRVSTQGNHRRT